MKKLSNLLNFWRWIVLCIFSISYSTAKSQCRIECNTNAGIYSDNNARTIAYDNMGSGFHSTFVSEKNGFRVWGENMQNNGTGHHLSPVTINSTNYPALTGTVYFVGIGSEWAGNVQLIVLTSTGLFASGTPGAVLSTGIKSTNTFSKLTINGKTDGLPSGIIPDSVKMMFVCAETIIITTCGGRVFVLAQSARVRGDLSVSSSSANTWSQVMRAAGQPLTNIIATRGTDRAAFALAADSTIWTWGDNVLLGNSTARVNRDYASQMTKPSGLGGIKMIQMTNFNFNYTFNQTSYYVLGTNNRIYSLGENNNGQLGDNTTTNRLAWVNVLNPNGTTVTDATWITANEHDPNLPNLGFIRSNAQMVTCGNNSIAMIGRVNGTATLIGATNHPDIPSGINSNDTILFCEIGGHTSSYIKYNTLRYGYVGHRVNGSVGDNSAVNSTLTSVNFVIPPIINVCGTRCDTPQIYGKPFNCNDSVMYFVIKSKSGNKVKYEINNNPADSVIIGISDSVILTLTNIGASQTLKILKVENIACNLSVAVNDTLKFTTRKDSFRTICSNQSVVFNGNILNTTGVYRDTFINSKGCDSFLVLHLTVNDTTKKDSFLAICRYNPIVFNGQTVSTSGVYRDTFINARGCDSFLYLHLTVNDTSRKDSFRTICKNQPIIFNGNSLNVSGIYRDTFVNSKGCDSFLVLNLTVNDTTKKDSFRTICKNQSVVFNGQTLNNSGVYRDTFVNSKGCDSFLYLHLTVNDTTRKDSFRTICKNQSVVFNGQTLNTTGVYRDTFVNSKGCDSFLVLNLTVNDTTKKDSFLAICRYNPIVFNGQTLSTSGVYRDTFVNARGCDSFLYLHLTVNDTSRKDSFRTICKNQPIIFNGNSLNVSGIYRDTFVNSKGCDSFLVLNLTVNDTTKKDSFRTICKNQSVVFNGQTLNTTGVYRDTFMNSKGCDSFLYLHLTVNDTTRKDSFRTICKNQSVVFNGNILNTTGVYRDTFVNAKGCDSFLVLHLTVNDTTKKDSFLAICRYNPIVFNGQTLSTSGVYRDTFVNARGCDSFLYLYLTVNDTSRKDSFRTICKNQPIIFNGNSLNISGMYRDTFVNAKGCDSFLVLNLTVNDTTKKDSFRTICKNQSVVFNGNILNTTGVYRDTFVNSKGCDSFLYLHLTVNDTTRKDSFRTICKNQPITFNGNILNTTGIYKDTFVNAKGCDSFLYLHLTVNDTTKKDSFLAICRYNPIVFNGQTLSISGVYRDTFVNVRGCDSFLYLHLTVNDTSRKDSFRTICKNQPIIFNGNSLNISGIYRDTFVNSKGCDSFLVLNLTVNDTTKKDSFRTICKNQSMVFNGQTLSTTGVYRDTFMNSKGCDSFLYLHLTVNDTTRKDSFRTICKNQSVVFNGQTLNTTGVYRDTFMNSKGCDSFLVLNLTVNDTTKKDSFLAICRYNPIVFNGQTLNTNGVYRDTFVNARGCDSFLYLHLTVNDTSRKDSFRTICKNQPIIFNGNSLNISGVYRDTFVNAKSCDSFLVLNLTVNDTTKKDSFRTICKNQSVVFNGQTLNNSGVYRDTFVNSKGCDSFLYLHLTVNDTTRKDSFKTICRNQSVVFNGNILNTTGVYRDTFVNSKGCDSFLVLNLTVNDTTKKDSFLAICRYNPIVFNGQTLSTSGVYRDTFVNARGCDSFLYLHLTVNDTSRKDSFRTICKNQPIIFNGNSLNVSGMYRDTFVNSKGCDSFLVLNLTVNDTTRKDSFRTICKNQMVTFNGQNLNTTGIYKDTFTNSKGCDSFFYLHLTVNDTTRKDSFKTICKNQSVVFNGNILNTTGIYKDTFVNAKGCDSFLVLHLTVNDTTNYFFTKSICQGDSFYFNSNFRLNSGNFKDTLINIAGCDSFVYLQLTVNPLPIANAGRDTIRINCSGDSVQLGSASIPNHSYRWFPDLNLSNGRIAQPYSKVANTTTYYMTIMNDITNCENTDTIKITVRESQMVVESITYNLKCKNSRDGMINLQAKKGFAPYQYKLSQMVYQDSGLFKNLPAGFNQYTVRDMKSCLFSDTFSLAEPTAIETVSKIRKHLTCYQSNDGEIEIIISGGTPPYSYLWTPSGDKDSVLKNLSATTYSLVLLDSNKCYYTDTVVLSEPPPIVIQDTIQKRNPCFGDSLGSIEVKLAGGTQPYRYLWSNGKREPKIQNLKQDTFYLKVTDTNNCIENFKIPLIKDPMPLLFDSLGSEMLNCQDFTNINLSGIGGTKPYVYSIDSGISFRSQKIFRVSEARLYHVQIMDANKCLTRDTHRVKGTEKIEIEVYPKDTVVGMGEPVELGYRYIKGDSTKVQSFIWKPGDGLSCTDCRNPIATPYVPMIYTIEVIYNDNCYHSDNARIRHTLDELFIPNAFSPDGPNIENQTLRIYSNNIYKAKLSIFNRWGEKIFESLEAHRIGWDGTYKGKKLNYDVFVYSAEIIYLSGRKVVKSGEVTLIR
ncbi:MAG: gliding motility-associated C-terminal domain-containing protein [Chitinophagales bacterium]|nr:gliding motility-associated C-terminal domain-containing protein [Chitinophagales bacterium]